MTKTELENAIAIKNAEIEAKQQEIDGFKIDPGEHEEDYKESLDSEGDVNVCGLTFSPSRIIEELDPIAYHCGLVAYVDGLDVSDDPAYKELEEELKALEGELADLESELEDLDDELEEMED